MNNLKFLSLIGYAPTILKPEVNNNYVVRSLNPVTYFPSPAGNGVTLCTFLPNQPSPDNLSQVRKPLSSFYNTFLPSLPKRIHALFLLTPQGGLATGDGKKGFSGVTLFTLCLSQRDEQKGEGSKAQSPKKLIPKPNRVLTPPLLTCYPLIVSVADRELCSFTHPLPALSATLTELAEGGRGISKAPSKGSNPFGVSRAEGMKLLSPFYPNKVEGPHIYSGKNRGRCYNLEPQLGVKGFRAGPSTLLQTLFTHRAKGLQQVAGGMVKRYLVKGARVRRGISRLVKVSKFRLTGRLNALNAFTRSLRKRISYLTLMVQFNGLIFLIKKIVKKQIANQSVNVLIKKLNFLILTFFKYIGSLSVDFWKVANMCSILPYTGSTNIAVGRSCCRIAYGISVGKGRWIGIERETRLKRVFRRLPTFFVRCPCAKSLYTYTFIHTPSLLALNPKGVRVKRLLEGRDKFAYKGHKQRVTQAKRAYISLFFCSIKSFKKMILEFSRYLKVYLYKILWKWVQKRDPKLSQITLIYKYWIFIQNNAKFYTLKQ